MQNSCFCLLLLIVFGMTSCHKTDPVNPTGAPLKDYTQDVQQAKRWLPGKWRLTKVWAMVPNPPVPNVELTIEPNRIELIQNGVLTDRVTYEIIERTGGLQITTNAQHRQDNWYIRNPSLYMNKGRIFLDMGVAVDGPGYEFSRIN